MLSESLNRFAAIDIGSNAVRLLLCNVVEDDDHVHFNTLELVRIPLRLGEDAFRLKRITAERSKRFIKTMEAFKLLIDVFNPVAYRACATASLREANNGQELTRMVRDTCGLDIEIISGKEEAELICSNHVEQHLDPENSYLYIDVGGGSTEVTLFDKGVSIVSRSFNIGTIRWIQGSVQKEDWEEMKEWVRDATRNYSIYAAIGSGGNINKINKILGKKDRPVSYIALKSFYEEMKGMTVEERMNRWELNPDRADVIVPAAKIFLGILKAAKVPEIIVPQIGLADGIVHKLYEDALSGE